MEVKTTVEHQSDIEKNIKIEIDRDLFNDKVKQRLGSAVGQVQLKGFRKGKAPKDLVEKLYGGHLRTEVLSELINSAYSAAVTENGLKVVGLPEIDIQDFSGEGPIQATAKVSIVPTPEIKNYFNESFEVEIFKPCDRDVSLELEKIQEQFSKLEDIEGRDIIEEGDVVTFDYTGQVDGVEYSELAGNGSVVEVKETRVREELKVGLLGKKLGEISEVNLPVSEQSKNSAIAGKTAQYRLIPRKIQKRVLHELNDELAEKARRGKTIEELKSNILKQIDANAEKQNRAAKETKLFEQLIEKNAFDVPQSLIDEEIRSILFEFGALDPNQDESYRRDVTSFRDSLSKPAETRVRRAIILSQLIKQENTVVDDAGIEGWLEERKEQIGCDREEVNRMYDYPKSKSRLKAFITEQKMIDKLLEKANINEVEKPHEH